MMGALFSCGPQVSSVCTPQAGRESPLSVARAENITCLEALFLFFL
jgi:hypothetical protein